MEHKSDTVVDSDHPAVLVGDGPRARRRWSTCCTPSPPASPPASPTSPPPGASSSRKVTSTVEGDIDLLGILGLSDGTVRNGYEQIRVTFHIEGDADDETLRGLVEQSRRRSAVYDVLTNPTPVVIDVVTG